jgi:hypothetical protein
MSATAGSTTIELPIPLKARLAKHRKHARQAYHEIVAQALDALEAREARSLDPLIAKHRVALRIAAKRNGISRIWLFGSRARNQARPDSDVDILYQAMPGKDLWATSSFQVDAEAILGVKVDVADLDALKPEMRASILPEAVPI